MRNMLRAVWPLAFLVGSFGLVFFVASCGRGDGSQDEATASATASVPTLTPDERAEAEAPAEVGCGITARMRKDLPSLPEGLVPLSAFYEMSVPPEAKEQGCLVTTIALTVPTQDPANLGFYTYEEGKWRRLAAATLGGGGTAAEAQLTDIPANMAVLRESR